MVGVDLGWWRLSVGVVTWFGVKKATIQTCHCPCSCRMILFIYMYNVSEGFWPTWDRPSLIFLCDVGGI